LTTDLGVGLEQVASVGKEAADLGKPGGEIEGLGGFVESVEVFDLG
jgi:hypothetical protein